MSWGCTSPPSAASPPPSTWPRHSAPSRKFFFGSALGTESGGNASSTAVRALIKQFVAAESAKKPLSDSQLSDMLKEQGIECARRTVAKYRESLRIAPTNLRKAL